MENMQTSTEKDPSRPWESGPRPPGCQATVLATVLTTVLATVLTTMLTTALNCTPNAVSLK